MSAELQIEKAVQIETVTAEEALDRIGQLRLREYGLGSKELMDEFQTAIADSSRALRPVQLVVGLDNADTAGVLLQAVRQEPEVFFGGIDITAKALNTDVKILHIPDYRKDLKEEWAPLAKAHGVLLAEGIITRRNYPGASIHHMITMLNVGEAFLGKDPSGIYISIDGADLQKVTASTKISELRDLNAIKAIQTGYRFLGAEAGEMTVEEAGVPNGVLNFITANDCIVSLTQKNLLESRRQSCGTCVFCREGLLQLEYMQNEITQGRGKIEFKALSKEIGDAMRFSTQCSVGENAFEIALSAMDLFEEEYNLHIKKKKCPAKKCFSAQQVYIDPHICTGCGECMDACPVNCIIGKTGHIHMIDEFDCTKCGNCISACPEEAIMQTSGKIPKLPNRLMKVGKFKK
ncbi:MAG: NADH-ubiquinone oxidoreductase-F iron-sulfur binding region domain-containing protein [Lachnospiraceae bacterium]